MITLGKTKTSKVLNSLVLIGLLIYAAGKLDLLPEFELETVKKVQVGEQVHSKMNAAEIESSLSYFFYNESSLKDVSSEEIRNSISVDYVLNGNGKVDTIELVTTLTSSPAREVLLKVHQELDDYVLNKMLQKFEAPKTIKQVTLNGSIVKILSNEEIQALLGEFFESNEAAKNLNPEGFEFKFIADHDGNIWQFELISTLPKGQAEEQITPLYIALSEFSKNQLISIANSK